VEGQVIFGYFTMRPKPPSEGFRRTITDSKGATRDVVDPNATMSHLLIRHNSDGSKTAYVCGLGLLYEADETDHTKTYLFDQVGSTIARTIDVGSVMAVKSWTGRHHHPAEAY